ncbi:MAG: hypothetical protein JAY74_08900 [Candidatus Thiodiazotropha taylori]|nr:hypothetical protein [Candidatus Thiodiazotropha taylori]
MNRLIRDLIEIGLSNKVIDLNYFLPNFPLLRGSEDIFRISRANANLYLDSNPDALIKGLHLIELEYKRQSSSYGFGSPSPTFMLIETLVEIDYELAHKLYNWISNSGGNYYIPRCRLMTIEESRRIAETEKSEIERAKKERKLKIQEKHNLIIEKQTKERIKRENLLNLNYNELYAVISNEHKKPIHYYEDAIRSIVENGISQVQKIKLINLIKRKFEVRHPKKLKELIGIIESSR